MQILVPYLFDPFPMSRQNACVSIRVFESARGGFFYKWKLAERPLSILIKLSRVSRTLDVTVENCEDSHAASF